MDGPHSPHLNADIVGLFPKMNAIQTKVGYKCKFNSNLTDLKTVTVCNDLL